MDEGILISEVVVEQHCRGKSEDGERHGGHTCVKADQQSKAGAYG
jgi:hypothetical protein